MGILVNGVWQDRKSAGDPADTKLNSWITPDGSAGPTGHAGFPAEPGRYHLYVSWACPFAHRALLARSVMGLQAHVGLTYMADIKRDDGWQIPAGADPVVDATTLYQLIAFAHSGYTGRASVPVLYDKVSKRIVSNSSADISSMLLQAFCINGRRDFRPAEKVAEIDNLNRWVHNEINVGVYRVGFSTQQTEYENAVVSLFDVLDELELRLANQPFLQGNAITESDLWLFATLIRFDSVYVPLFKCTLRRISDYPQLSRHLQRLWVEPGVATTVKMERIKAHYFQSLMNGPDGPINLNPTGLIPMGPDQSWLDV